MCSPRTAFFAIALSLFTLAPASAGEPREVPRPKSDPVVSAALRERAARTAAQPIRVWIAFTDKGTHLRGGVSSSIASIEQSISPLGLKKIRRRGWVLGLEDLTVCEEYVAEVASAGARVRHRLRWFNAVSADVFPADVATLAALPFVAAIDLVRGTPMSRVEDLPFDWGQESTPREDGAAGGPPPFYGHSFAQYDKIEIDEAHAAGYTGTGVVIAMFDSGFDRRHLVFRSTRVLGERDFVQDDDVTWDQPGMADAYPDIACQMNHGTSTWSCTGGYYPGKMIGVAFGASFLLAKTEYVSSETHVEEDNWAAAAEWAWQEGADIISASLGYRYDFSGSEPDYSWDQLDGKTTIIARAANLVTSRGVLVVNSAGNEGFPGDKSVDGFKTIISPSDSDSVLAVGGVFIGSEQRVAFSSMGPCAPACPSCPERIKPDVMAPGTGVYGAIAQGGVCGTASEDDPFSESLSGTSFSCPIAAGAAALVLEAHPEWTPFEIRRAMKERTKQQLQHINPSAELGWGVLRVQKAIEFESPAVPALPLPFELLGPAPFSETQTGVADDTPTFSWRRAVPGQVPQESVYTLEISPDFFFTSPRRFTGITDTTFAPSTPLDEGFYYWRVLAAPPAAPDLARESQARNQILIDFPPTEPDLLFPTDGDSLSTTLTPRFRWRAAHDASPVDTVRYRVRIGFTDDFGTGTKTYDAGTDTTLSFPAAEGLEERRTYFARVEAIDRFGATSPSATISFETGEFPPLPFALGEPAQDTDVTTRRPTFTWDAARDLYVGDSLVYEVYLGTSRSSLTRVRLGLQETSWLVDQGLLQDDTTVYWAAAAVDLYGARTFSADTVMFRVRTAPLPFDLSSPPDGDVVYVPRPTFGWQAAPHDLPSETMTYTLRVYADEALTDLVASVADQEATTVRINGNLSEGTYYWNVVAKDSRGREGGSAQAFSVVVSPAPLELAARLGPNPFAPRAGDLVVTFDVPSHLGGRPLSIDVHDVMGRTVRRLVSGAAGIGAAFEARWDGRGDNGARLPAGVYYLTLDVGGEIRSERVVVIGR